MHQSVTVSSTMWPNTCTNKHSLAHLQDLIPTLASIKYYIDDNTSQGRD